MPQMLKLSMWEIMTYRSNLADYYKMRCEYDD